MLSSYSRTLVTSALPYANGDVHLGHLAGAYLPADMYVRYKRLLGEDILFICGSDEHGVSILISATKEGITPKEIIDRYHEANKRAFERVGISFDNYSRTSEPVHHETAQHFFRDFLDKGILESKEEEQLYDESAKMFLPDRFVIGTCPHCGFERAYGDQCENCSKYYNQTELVNPQSLLSDSTPVVRKGLQWYFPLGKYQERLERYVASHKGEWKDNVYAQVQSWLKAGLSDRPITRDMNWGVPVPIEGSAGKVLYVWFEAVLGYISSTKEWATKQGDEDKWKKYWCSGDTRYLAFIGKDNIVFHCLMFPAMLMDATGYVLPDNVPANEFLNLEGKKFSKSMNWSIELNDFLDRYPADSLRYALALNLPESKDGDFYWKDFQARNNNELADIFGNFVNRTIHFVKKNFDGVVPAPGIMLAQDQTFFAELAQSRESIAAFYERFRFRDAVNSTMNLARVGNRYFNDQEPWKILKTDRDRCGAILNNCLQSIYAMVVLFEPIIPHTAMTLRTMLNLNDTFPVTWNEALSKPLPRGHTLGEQALLFQKIEDDAIDSEIGRLGNLTATPDEVERSYAPLKETITIDDVLKLDLRTATVIDAERVPKSNKLIRIQIDLGFEKRQIVAGIGKEYDPSALIGKTIIVVANLATAKLMGVESQGMLLAASNDERGPVILIPESEIENGSIVK